NTTTNDYNDAGTVDNGPSLTFDQTGLTCNTPYTLYVWGYNGCTNSLVTTLTQTTTLNTPTAPTEAAHTAYPTEIVWNWNASQDATGYKYNTTTNDYNDAGTVDNGPSLTFDQTGVTCNTPYTLYVW